MKKLRNMLSFIIAGRTGYQPVIHQVLIDRYGVAIFWNRISDINVPQRYIMLEPFDIKKHFSEAV